MKRLGRIVKWIGIVAVATIANLLMLNAYFVWSTGTQLERRLIALRQAGDPVQLADLAREPLATEKNADVFLSRAADNLDAIEKELHALYPKAGYPTGPLTPAEHDRLAKLFAANPNVMPLLEQAADCPDSDPQLEFHVSTTAFLDPYMKHATRHRLVSRVIKARSAWLLSNGRGDDALSAQLVMLRLTRHWRREPLIIASLVTSVCEVGAMDGINQVLQTGPVSPSARGALDRELALHDTMEGYNWALRSERAYSLSSAREVPGTSLWVTRGFGNELGLGLIAIFDHYLEKGAHPYAEVAADKRRFNPGSGPKLYGALVTLLEPALLAVREPAERTRAMSRCLRILNAVQVHVPKVSDRVPKLTELRLPAEATLDPYNGEPLRLKKRRDGWMVYAVGRDLADDGGALDTSADIGVGPIRRAESKKKG
jgi:hypothetical protein